MLFHNFVEENVRVVFMNVSFGNSVASGLSHLIGKAAHVSLLSSESLLRLFTCLIKPLLELYFVSFRATSKIPLTLTQEIRKTIIFVLFIDGGVLDGCQILFCRFECLSACFFVF